MWEDIMETDTGKEFSEWMREKYGMGYECEYDDAFSYVYSCELVKDNIINNLAVEFLDSKRYYVNTNEVGAGYEGFSVEVNKDNRQKFKEYAGTRQEAIQIGVKKAFEILNQD